MRYATKRRGSMGNALSSSALLAFHETLAPMQSTGRRNMFPLVLHEVEIWRFSSVKSYCLTVNSCRPAYITALSERGYYGTIPWGTETTL